MNRLKACDSGSEKYLGGPEREKEIMLGDHKLVSWGVFSYCCNVPGLLELALSSFPSNAPHLNTHSSSCTTDTWLLFSHHPWFWKPYSHTGPILCRIFRTPDVGFCTTPQQWANFWLCSSTCIKLGLFGCVGKVNCCKISWNWVWDLVDGKKFCILKS